MYDHCTSCHETFDQAETIHHQNGADECPRCHRQLHCIGLADDGTGCPECDDDNEGLGEAPDCYGQGDYACGSEQCDWCPFEETCS